jgi:CSLREA domain-containing protein
LAASLLIALLSSSLQSCTLLDEILGGLARTCDADPLLVTKTDDTNDGLCTAGDCSLREAVVTANACPGHQTVEVPAGGYHLTRLGAGEDAADTGDLDITDDLTINGIDVPSIHGDDQDRVIEIFDPAVVELNLLLIVEGREQLGAGIWNHSVVTINSSAINNNHAAVPPEGVGTSGGGGLHNDQGAQATIVSTQFLENTGDHGAGIHNFALAQLTMEGGMLAGNVATGDGGAVWNNFEAEATLTGVDFVRNQADGRGGAIYNDGRLNTERNKFEENTQANQGGGVFNGPDAEAFLYEAWFTNNSADLGGAVFNQGLLHLYQSSLTVNSALGGFGGGAYNDGGGSALLIQNTTLSGNMIVPPGSPGGSGVYNAGGDLRVEFSTFAYNNADGILNDAGNATIESSALAYHASGNCAGDPLMSSGHNIEDGDSCGLIEASDLVETDPLLAPLAMNGGSNLNHALLAGSPALDSGDTDTCISVDQRGVSRPQGGGCDRGAYEVEAGEVPAEPPPSPTPEITATPWPPIEINFNADAYQIFMGACTTLRWEVVNAEMVAFEGLTVPSLEAEPVCPTVTTSYVLNATNPSEEAEAIVTITVLPPPPADPGSLDLSLSCGGAGYQVKLSWDDKANNEDGYRVYRDGERIATLDDNTEGYTDDPGFGGPYKYSVEAFNDSGASGRSNAKAPECP